MRENKMDWEQILELEREVFPHYCKDSVIKCATPNCTFHNDDADIRILTISRINGDKYRPKFCFNVKLLKKLKRENYPEGYQVLCENCQAEKVAKSGRMYW